MGITLLGILEGVAKGPPERDLSLPPGDSCQGRKRKYLWNSRLWAEGLPGCWALVPQSGLQRGGGGKDPTPTPRRLAFSRVAEEGCGASSSCPALGRTDRWMDRAGGGLRRLEGPQKGS